MCIRILSQGSISSLILYSLSHHGRIWAYGCVLNLLFLLWLQLTGIVVLVRWCDWSIGPTGRNTLAAPHSLAHSIIERAADWGVIVIDHTLIVSFTGNPKLVLVISAVTRIVLRNNRILEILIICDRSHKIVVLGDKSAILSSARTLSLLSYSCLWGILGWLVHTFHILCNYVIFWHLRANLVLITSALLLEVVVSIKSAVMRCLAHAHVVETNLWLMEQLLIDSLLIRRAWKILSLLFL